jgi:hypothetical protein
MIDITLLPSAKVPLIYQGDTMMTTEWYRFFWNIYGFTGTGVIPTNKGGTGLDTIGNHQVIIGNANNVFEPAVFTGSGININYSPGIINLAIGESGVTPGTYGSATQVGVFTVNQYGNITAATNTLIGIDANQIVSGTLPVVRGGTGQSSYTNGQLLIGNNTGNTLTKATLTAGAGVTITNGPGTITIAAIGGSSITSYAYTATAGQTVFTGLSYTPGNNGLSVYVNGSKQLTSVNYTETNTTTVTFASGLNVGDVVEMDVIAAAAGLSGVTGVTGTAPIVSTGGSTPAISMPAATTSVSGYLTSTDWTTFNNKQAALVSGTNIKTVGGTSLLGSGDVNTIGNATNAVNVAITDDTTTNSNYYVTFVTASSGNTGIKTSASKLKYNPSTGALTASIIYIAP